MKRINNLYSQIYKTKNIFLADKRARKAKRNSYGVKDITFKYEIPINGSATGEIPNDVTASVPRWRGFDNFFGDLETKFNYLWATNKTEDGKTRITDI